MSRAEDLFQTLVAGGEAAILDLIRERASEELFLDFKGTATLATHNRLQQDDRDNHAKALSGFGNTAGGVILWGVDCRNVPSQGDVARALVPVAQVARFKSWLESDVSGATLPSHVGVRHSVCGERPDGSGFAATLVPAADHGPLQVPGQWRYYMRAGSAFVPIPHAMLAAMFGRRPTPQLSVKCTVSGPLEVAANRLSATGDIMVRNDGLGIARDLFLAAGVQSLSDVRVRIKTVNDPRLQPIFGLGHSRTVMSHPQVAFPPGSELVMAFVEVEFTKEMPVNYTERPPSEAFSIDISVGCGNGPTSHMRLSQSVGRLRHTSRLVDARPNENQLWYARRVLGLVED